MAQTNTSGEIVDLDAIELELVGRPEFEPHAVALVGRDVQGGRRSCPTNALTSSLSLHRSKSMIRSTPSSNTNMSRPLPPAR